MPYQGAHRRRTEDRAATVLRSTAVVTLAAIGGTVGWSLAAPSGTEAQPVSLADRPAVTAPPATAARDAAAAAPSTSHLATAPGQPATSTPPTDAPDAVVRRPTRLRIDAIDVDAEIIPLDVGADGALETPSDFATAGWWVGGPEPGEPGPTVIAGHVDSASGPAVFYDLRRLQPGDVVTVEGDDGTRVTYAVARLEQHAKTEFPTAAVYGDTPTSTLRLVTCAGGFDAASGHYRDNLVVYAEQIVEDGSPR